MRTNNANNSGIIKLKDLVAVAQSFNKKKIQNPQKKAKQPNFIRPEYLTIAEAPTMGDIVKIINNHPNICNRLAAQALMDYGDYKTSQQKIEAHADRLLNCGAKFHKQRTVRIVLMAIKEGVRLN